MALLIGILLALITALFSAAVGFDRSRALYPITLIVIASYYVLFAVMAEAHHVLLPELLVFCAFTAAAVLGFRKNLWIAAAGLAAHGVLDVVHGGVISNPGVPAWLPAFCLGYDLMAAACLAALLLPAPRPHVALELDAADAEQRAGRMDAAFARLERAHVLGQQSTFEHVRVHWRMLAWALRQRDLREGVGQAIRLIAAAIATPFGLVPTGNTGGANVSALRRMDTPADLAAIMAAAKRRSARGVIAAAAASGALFGQPAPETAPGRQLGGET